MQANTKAQKEDQEEGERRRREEEEEAAVAALPNTEKGLESRTQSM